MASIVDRRVTAHIQGDFVVFLIGMRVNRLWKPHKWLPNLRAMPKMLKELEATPAERGFLGYTNLGLFSLVQYWRSFDHLEAYARARDMEHWPAWLEFNRLMIGAEASCTWIRLCFPASAGIASEAAWRMSESVCAAYAQIGRAAPSSVFEL